MFAELDILEILFFVIVPLVLDCSYIVHLYEVYLCDITNV